MTDEWLWVSHDGEIMERGSRKHVEAERGRYERECRERGIVPAVTDCRPKPRGGAVTPMTARDELFELFGEARDQRSQQDAQRRFVLGLLRGDGLLFGHQVEVVFPDGQPLGKSNAELADLFDVG